MERVGEPLRDPVGANEVPARASRDDGELDAFRPAMPFTISWTVPSPPKTTSSSAPSSAAPPGRRAGPRSEKIASPRIPAAWAARASSGQRRPVLPFADAGLTRRTVFSARASPGDTRPAGPRSRCAGAHLLLPRLKPGRGRVRTPAWCSRPRSGAASPEEALVRGDRPQRQLGHLVDRRLHLLVRDPHELALDDDVADREQAAGGHLAEGADREEERPPSRPPGSRGRTSARTGRRQGCRRGRWRRSARPGRSSPFPWLRGRRRGRGQSPRSGSGARSSRACRRFGPSGTAVTAMMRSPSCMSGWSPPQVPTRRNLRRRAGRAPP